MKIGNLQKCLMLSAFVLAALGSNLYASTELEINSKLPNKGVKKGFIHTEAGPREVKYKDTGRVGLYQGDILVPKGLKREDLILEDVDGGLTTNAVVRDGFRWPNNTLHYRFDTSNAEVRLMTRRAVQHITDNTNVRIVELGDNDTSRYHVKVQDSDSGCYSYVGYLNGYFSGSQDLNVVSGCGFGSTVHEFLHALGIWHEQSREDRDNHVNIYWDNIESPFEDNFEKQIDGSSDVGAYNYNSIMHYSEYAFSKNGLRTIQAKVAGVTLGQRNGLSAGDISAINTMYPIITTPPPPPPPPPVRITQFLAPLVTFLMDEPEIECGNLEVCIDGPLITNGWTSASPRSFRRDGFSSYFVLENPISQRLQIDLISQTDTYLYMALGNSRTANDYYNDDGGDGLNSRIIAEFAAGSYLIEATQYSRISAITTPIPFTLQVKSLD